ncbi:MAG: hypothetical protein CL484_06445 [Acidobacteria bacterium]|nr:hypothetical protein [Acidobacteriota bacterium]
MKRLVVFVFLSLLAHQSAGQVPPSEGVPRTADGRPDLTGLWTTQTFTPLQRPEEFGERSFLTDEEVATLTRVLTAPGVDPLRGRAFADAVSVDVDRRTAATEQADPTHYDNSMWLRTADPKGLSSRRTSLIVDPTDGRIPSRTEEGLMRAQQRRDQRGYDSYQNRPAQERCLVWTHEGPPMMPPPYNDLYQIFQTPDHVVVFAEMANNPPRIIGTNGGDHVSPRIRQWPGHSIGRWEGDTLVVDTTNFTEKTGFQGSGDSLRVVERFTRLDADTIRYEFTVEDPTTWSRPWSVQLPMVKTQGPLYPYTCHEGNYGMVNTLRGARRADGEGR